ncbi:MAG: DUF4301 family protein [Bacteroidales bacterium]|nr:DUF4301 family protein [Bacteroidales bacterium]
MDKTEFTPQDLEFMRRRGSDPAVVKHQLECFRQGFGFADLDRAATLDDGILRLDPDVVDELCEDYPHTLGGKKVLKFVPASGAASRMFKELYSYLTDDSPETRQKALNFLEKLPKFPFYEALGAALAKDGYDMAAETKAQNYKLIVRYLLESEGLNYGNQPKGLLLFHRYPDKIRTAVEEHLVEAALYARNDDECHLHFTVSPQHQAGFEALLDRVVPLYEKQYGVKYHIDFSIQDPATDTVAAELDNSPFRDEKGDLLFRPAGHGALIHNMDKLDADVVFVKNIDNVITEERVEPTVRYKKALAAHLLQLQARTFQYLRLLEAGEVDDMMLCEILDFAESDLMISLGEDVTREMLYDKLNRPIRVCGMVKNEGEPGGGPFWVTNADGETSLQIVESSQIDKNDPEQMDIMTHATHFNPVDMVCGLKDYKGNRFDLTRYVDPATGFISSKSYGDRTLKALELPGLWNGAMSRWITIFVEVPIETFNPVKTVFDLLRR